MSVKGGALDLICYDPLSRFVIGGEVKKSNREVDALIANMALYASDPGLPEPPKDPHKNAFRKVVSIRKNWPRLFWAIGPEGYSKVFAVQGDGIGRFELLPTPESRLNHAS